MMIEMREVVDLNEKAMFCNNILRTLPGWFGIESSIADYTKEVKSMPFYTAFENNTPVGFVAIKVHNTYTSEVYVMGVLEEFHRKGIGKMLIERCERYCIQNKMEFLTVKTLDESRESKSYEKTRLFYHALGFRPLEVFPLLWSKDNPCLFMSKYVPL